MKLFVTGGTGFLGKAAIAGLAHAGDLERCVLLIRKTAKQSADERLQSILETIFSQEEIERYGPAFRAVEGDLTKPLLGLTAESLDKLRGEIDRIYHLGASTDFGSPLEIARRNNVQGTQYLVDFIDALSQGNDKKLRIDFVSTAYVAGTRKGIVRESDLDRGQSFANAYEQSKNEAEALIRQHQSRFDLVVHRPSVVVGDSRTGYTPHFKVLYWPIKVLARGLVPAFPINRRAFLDIVPVDYVTRCSLEIMRNDQCIGKTFHITSGLGNETSLSQLVTDIMRFTNVPRKTRQIPWWMFSAIDRRGMRWVLPADFWQTVNVGRPYADYFRGTGIQFDSSNTEALMGPKGVKAPSWASYAQSILTYPAASRWGKKPPQEEHRYYRF